MKHLLTACLIAMLLASNAAHATDEANPQLIVQISALEEELRNIRGKLEEQEFRNQKLADELEKFRKDIEFRFGELSSAQAVNPIVAASPAGEPSATPASGELVKPVDAPAVEKTPADKAADKTLEPPIAKEDVRKPINREEVQGIEPEKPAGPPVFDTAREHYNYAFKLLNQSKYDDAEASFKEFTKKHPKDQLTGNAYYWLGETYYIRRDFVSAADNFRQGFEVAPAGPKAPDNLLKLGMALDSLKRTKEACVVLGQVKSKFGKSAANIAQKAETEIKRIGCK